MNFEISSVETLLASRIILNGTITIRDNIETPVINLHEGNITIRQELSGCPIIKEDSPCRGFISRGSTLVFEIKITSCTDESNLLDIQFRKEYNNPLLFVSGGSLIEIRDTDAKIKVNVIPSTLTCFIMEIV